VQQRPEGLASPGAEDGRGRVRSRREGLQHSETALVEPMNRIADSVIGAVQGAYNRSRGLPLGTGKEDLAAAYRKGGRGPETGF